MNVYTAISALVALWCLALASFVMLRDSRPLVHRAFMGGMIALALETFLGGLSLQISSPDDIIRWQQLRMTATAFLPGSWLLFSLSFGRTQHRGLWKKCRYVVLFAFLLAPFLSVGFRTFTAQSFSQEHFGWWIRLDSLGYGLYLALAVSSVLIVMNLVETLRASVGLLRWQVKFTLLGIGGIFAFRIYSCSQALLFNSINAQLETASLLTVTVAVVLVSISLTRLPNLKADVYISPSLLTTSITVLIAGIYFIAVGVLAKILDDLHPGDPLHVEVLLSFIACVGLSILLLSERARAKLRQWIHIHLKRPQYDYRKEWIEFTEATTSVTDVQAFCTAIASKISRTFNTFCATVWLTDDAGEGWTVGGATGRENAGAEGTGETQEDIRRKIVALRDRQTFIDFSPAHDRWVLGLKNGPGLLGKGNDRYGVPLSASGMFLGAITLGERVTGTSFSWEDVDLLKTMAHQTAGMLLNLNLFERLRKIRETETIQTMASFMIHDLKNLGSTLSLTVQNLSAHFDNPEFQKDALALVQDSVSKIEGICHRLSMVSRRIELHKDSVDLNELVVSTLSTLNGVLRTKVFQDLHPLPRLLIDSEQIGNALTNLLLNANEAIQEDGQIQVTTERKDGWIVLAVSDTGCGMSKDFVKSSLFKPFHTTKKKGMGIGLYYSRRIVEAHQGQIEVLTQEGKGSTFRLMFPMT